MVSMPATDSQGDGSAAGLFYAQGGDLPAGEFGETYGVYALAESDKGTAVYAEGNMMGVYAESTYGDAVHAVARSGSSSVAAGRFESQRRCWRSRPPAR